MPKKQTSGASLVSLQDCSKLLNMSEAEISELCRMRAIPHIITEEGLLIFPDKEVLLKISPRAEGAPLPQAKVDLKNLTKEQILELFQSMMAMKAQEEAAAKKPEETPAEEEKEETGSPTEKEEEPRSRPDLAPPPGKTVGPTTLPPPGKTTAPKAKASKKETSKKKK